MIEFHYKIDFEIKDSERTSEWIEQLIIEEGKEMGEITYIFCNDKFLLERNQKYLNHDTLTDIITFDYCKGNVISSDITDDVIPNIVMDVLPPYKHGKEKNKILHKIRLFF